ncbi:Hypothetical protein ORPV_1014 [Orpheovirus IHUMI-LCC2]|uniref:Uncharacterized protein n=1 Tax=Orpheovirus IHUMI-LCC2 TaxID=2023057 RepID=A0A2I2L5U1_9VIRU|nr:Hypothetical protein ORPV_1014 [Orpheovirus IHUMI-LCC2]SNW62918.1 Hypothetical protein ORPV_1014 [Orpheovirus IHUMI-LCC2]
MELEVTLTLTTQFPNYSGELSFFDLNKNHTRLEYSPITKYMLIPDIWIGEKGLWAGNAKLKENYPLRKPYLLIETKLIGDMNINDAVESGMAKELNLQEALDVIKDATGLGYVAAMSSKVTNVDSLERRGITFDILNVK